MDVVVEVGVVARALSGLLAWKNRHRMDEGDILFLGLSVVRVLRLLVVLGRVLGRRIGRG